MGELLDLLWQLVQVLGAIAGLLLHWIAVWALLIVWLAWWTWGVNWKRVWPILREGAWMPAVLLLVITALVWSRLAPGSYEGLGVTRVPNFWWQLGALGLLAILTLACGWVQDHFHWTPAHLDLEPPVAHENGHEHPTGHHGDV